MNAQNHAHLSARSLRVSRPTRGREQRRGSIRDKRQSFSFSSSIPFSPFCPHSESHEVSVHNTIRLVKDLLGQGAPGAVEQLCAAELKGARGDCCRPIECEVSAAEGKATAGRDDLNAPHQTPQLRKAMAVKALPSWKGRPSPKEPGSLVAPLRTRAWTHTRTEPLRESKA